MISWLGPSSVTIGRLRSEAPSWDWSVTGRGFAGREYTGTRDGEEVSVLLTSAPFDADNEFPGGFLVYPGGHPIDEWLRANGQPKEGT